MGVTGRTLQRQLADEETSFRELLDSARRRVVVACRERDRTFDDTARMAGFRDAMALRDALRRWQSEQSLSAQSGQALRASGASRV